MKEVTVTFTLNERDLDILRAMINVDPPTYFDMEDYIRDAVERALEADAWLVKTQDEDGDWEDMR